MIKRTLTIIFILLSIDLTAETYEASTLHNAVSRSETVLGLFTDRWKMLEEKNFYIDVYGKINWTYDFNVNTYNSGSGQYEAVDLNLVRTYGTMTLALPVTGFRNAERDTDLILAVSMAGFHYGLTKDVEIDRGSAGSETTTDYKHSQFFDDIYAVSVLFRPYIYLHTGLIVNNEYVPDEDGTMSYSDPVNSYKKFFISSNVLEMLGLQVNADKSSIEEMKVSVNATMVYTFFSVNAKKSIFLPQIELTYEYIEAYNDDPWDAVWVGDTTGKTSYMDSSEKNSAVLNLLSLKLNQRLSKNFTTETQFTFQYITDDIYLKEESEKIDPSVLKEFHFLFAYEPVLDNTTFKFKLYTGVSWYWDPAVAIHRETGSGYDLWGWILGLDFGTDTIGLESKVVYNYSTELRKLVEAADKWSFEGSLFFRI